jgi:hypothetical protein
MRFQSVLRLLFIVYCMEAGFFLLLGPWNSSWDRTVLLLPSHFLRVLLLNPLMRGAVSGFGLVHLVWSTHDVSEAVARRLGVELGDLDGRRKE